MPPVMKIPAKNGDKCISDSREELSLYTRRTQLDALDLDIDLQVITREIFLREAGKLFIKQLYQGTESPYVPWPGCTSY